NALERAVLLCEEEWIPPALLPNQTPGPIQDEVIARILDAGTTLEALEQRLLEKALELHGNQSRAARALGLTRRVFQYRVKKLPSQRT
ncbi:MAG: two-component system response regulator, partial [Nitrospirae bacterium]|nr:two-component system response regulator [Nitrospirota bacterium]